MWTFNDQLPVVFCTGSMLNFLETRAVERVTVVYEPLLWNVSERIFLIESLGTHYAYFPRAELPSSALDLFARLDQRFADARPQSEKDSWRAGVSGALSLALTLGVMAFLMVQLKAQYKSLKFIEPDQVHGSIDDLVGMNDIKAEVAQIMDQYARRAEYAEYGIKKPFNVMFSGPAGTAKTKLASYLAKALRLPILFHSAANLETGYVSGGSNTLGRIMTMARQRRQCIVFLDEAQDLFMKRGGHRKFDDDTANTLLSVLDGVRSKQDTEIIWIVASNFNSETMEMDEAMLRRFQMKVDFRLPNREERLAIIGHDVRVLLGGMANEELFFGEDGTTNGAHNNITRVTQLRYHAVGEMGMYRKTRLNFGSLMTDRSGGGREPDEETRSLMEAQSERLYCEAKAVLLVFKPLTDYLVSRLLQKGEMSLAQALSEIRSFEALQT